MELITQLIYCIGEFLSCMSGLSVNPITDLLSHDKFDDRYPKAYPFRFWKKFEIMTNAAKLI